MESKKIRYSNIEFLRIVSMIMIIIFHISVHCVRFQLVDKASIYRMENGLFCHPVFYKRLFLIEGALPLGIIANSVFILISGYFMVERGKGIDIGNVSKKLLLQVGFADIILTMVTTIYYKIVVPDGKTIISMRSIIDFNSMNWFVGYYYLVIVFAAVFFNGFIEKLDQKKYRNILLAVFGVFSLGWSGGVLEEFAGGTRTLVCGIFLYALGGYIKRYDPLRRIKAVALVGIIVVL